MRRERGQGIAIGLLVGLAVGAVGGLLAGLLIAPVTGREARRRLAEARGQVAMEIGDVLERVAEAGDALAEWAARVVGAEAQRTRTRLAELKADVERLSASRG